MGKLVFLFCILFFSTLANADVNKSSGAVLLNPKAYSINISEYVFATTANFDAQGHENSLPTDTSYQYSDTDFKINYGIVKNLEASVMLRVRRVQSSSMNGSEAVNLNKLGLESGQVGIKYQFAPIGNNYFAVGGHFRQTLYTNPKFDPGAALPANTIVLGDDGSEYSVDFYSTFLFPKNRIDAVVSYVSPPNDLSSEVNYKFEVLHQFEKFGILAGVNGIFSLKKDAYTDSPNTKPTMTVGSTTLFNSINHELMTAYIGSSYDFNKVGFEVRGGAVINGVNTDKGYFALFNINFGTAGVTQESVKIESFKEYHIDGSVLKVSPRGNFVKIDQGLSTDVEKGMQFDIYQTDYFGGNVLVATGVVFEVGADWSVIKLVKKYNNIEIKPGFAARGK